MKIICQSCGKNFREQWCRKDKLKGMVALEDITKGKSGKISIGDTIVYICPYCKHGNYSDNVKGKLEMI